MNTNTRNLRVNINVITEVEVDHSTEKTIDLSVYALASRDKKDIMIASLIAKMREQTTIAGTYNIKVRPEINYYSVPTDLTNQLGYYYSLGCNIVIDGHTFTRQERSRLFKYTYTTNVPLTQHAINYFNQHELEVTLNNINTYNKHVVQQISEINKEIWTHAEDFYRATQEVKLGKATVYQPNKKVYYETHGEQYTLNQLKQLLPELAYTDDKGRVHRATIKDMVMTEKKQIVLDTFRKAYGIPSDNFEVWTTSKYTEHGYAQDITQIYEVPKKKAIKSGYAGGSLDEITPEYVAHGAQKEIFTKPQYFEQKAFVNWFMLKQYQELGLLEEDYIICPICKMPTKAKHAFCDNCNKIRPEADEEIQDTIEDIQQQAIDLIKRNHASEELLKYRKLNILEVVLSKLDYTDIMLSDIGIVQVDEPEVQLYGLIKTKDTVDEF